MSWLTPEEIKERTEKRITDELEQRKAEGWKAEGSGSEKRRNF